MMGLKTAKSQSQLRENPIAIIARPVIHGRFMAALLVKFTISIDSKTAPAVYQGITFKSKHPVNRGQIGSTLIHERRLSKPLVTDKTPGALNVGGARGGGYNHVMTESTHVWPC